MELLIWLGIILLILPFIYFGIGAYAAITLTAVGEHPQYSRDPGDFGVDYALVHFRPRNDRLTLSAWYLPGNCAEAAMILVHGRNASKQNAISGCMPELAAKLQNAGFAVLVIDLRGHGDSEGKRHMWGVHERRDILGAVDFLCEQGYKTGRIGVLGVSLGGAAATGAAAEDEAIGALVLDSTFATLPDLIDQNWTKEAGLPKFLLPGVSWTWRLLFGFSIKDVRPIDEIQKILPRPILIIHSQSDTAVPVRHALQLAEAAPTAQIALFEDCDHAELFSKQPEKYLEVVVPFLLQELL